MAPVVKVITPPVALGEGPHWDSSQNCLYYVSVNDQDIFKYVPSTGEHTSTKIDGGRVGFLIPIEGTRDQFIAGVGRRFLVIQWDGTNHSTVKVIKELAEVDQGTQNRINDAKCDPKGRLFGGTMGREEAPGTLKFEEGAGALYRLVGSNCTKLAQGIGISNGLAWNLREKSFYYVDSLEYNIRRYDYDVETGEISNMRYIFDFKANNLQGLPDGITIDVDGNIWAAVFGGSCIVKIDPKTEKLLQTVPIPAQQVTSVTFGGPDLDILFVTSANFHGKHNPPSGSCFAVTGLGVKGYLNVNAKLN